MSDSLLAEHDWPPPLTDDEEFALARQIEAGVLAQEQLSLKERTVSGTRRELECLVAEGEAAKEQFLLANVRLVLWEIYRNRSLRFSAIAELVDEGMVAMIQALNNFDYKKELRFSTYAVPWIRFRLFRYARQVVEVPDECVEQIPVSWTTNESSWDLARVWPRLDPLVQQVLGHRFGFDGPVLSYRDTASKLGLGISRVRRIEKEAIDELRGWMSADAA